MKYTLFAKSCKPADLLITLEEALPILRRQHGTDGRAIIHGLFGLMRQHAESRANRPLSTEELFDYLPWKRGGAPIVIHDPSTPGRPLEMWPPTQPCADCLTLERSCPRCLNT